MEKIDARKHSPVTQYEIRKQVVRLRKQGFMNIAVAEGVGVSVGRASKIWRSYKKEGSKAIKLGKRGRRQTPPGQWRRYQPAIPGSGRTPLYVTAISKNNETAKLLMKEGAKTEIADKAGYTPLTVTFLNAQMDHSFLVYSSQDYFHRTK